MKKLLKWNKMETAYFDACPITNLNDKTYTFKSKQK